MVLSNESKIKAVLNQYSSIVTTGPSTKALLVEDYDTVVREILSVLSLNNDVPPQLNKHDVMRSKALELLSQVIDNVGEVKNCSLMHKGCVAFTTTDGGAYKLKVVPQDEVCLDSLISS